MNLLCSQCRQPHKPKAKKFPQRLVQTKKKAEKVIKKTTVGFLCRECVRNNLKRKRKKNETISIMSGNKNRTMVRSI